MSGFYYLLYPVCTILSASGAWLIARYGHGLNLLDRPNERSSHRDITPRGGGIGILAGFITAVLFLKVSAFFWVPAVVLALISFAGDRWHLSILLRLLFQFTASLIFLLGFDGNIFVSSSGILVVIVLSIYLVGTTNYYNFMDGINGIAGVTGVVGFALLVFYGVYFDTDFVPVHLNLCMVFCCLAFLPFNMPKARVFMGDVGSILLGFVFAGMVIWYSNSLLEFLCLTTFLFPFYADEITTELIRLKNKEKLWHPHRKHLYQLLANEYNIPHWKISVGYGLVQIVAGTSAMLLYQYGIFMVVSLVFLYFCIFSVISTALRKRRIEPAL